MRIFFPPSTVRRTVCSALLATATGLHFSVAAEPLMIYVAPKGSDQAEGNTEKTAVASLDRVQELVAGRAAGYEEVRVLFLPGTYRGMTVNWHTFPGVWVKFMPARENGKVIFDGRKGRSSVFFTGAPPKPKRGQAPKPMKLEFRNLNIRYYCEAISLKSWVDTERTAGGSDNVVVGNVFEYIGSKYDPVKRGKKPRGSCTAALRLQGVARNQVEGNTFRHIINLPIKETAAARYGPGHLHAIYIAHLSDDNKISANSFDDFSGDPIRIRDKSNRNRVTDNVFGSTSDGIKPGAVHAVSQWYCNRNVKDCVEKYKDRRECASDGLDVQNNRIEGKNVASYADRSQGPATCAD